MRRTGLIDRNATDPRATLRVLVRAGAAWVLAAAALLPLAACYESPRPRIYEPGEYKGEPDPLVQLSKTTEHDRKVRERFDLVQRDR